MALVLTGLVNGCRPVAGTVQQGERKGEEWRFLSLEVIDQKFGKLYSCQLRDRDPSFKEWVNGDKMTKELQGHKVKVTVMGISAGQREIEDRDTGESKTIIQVRCQVTNIRDLGIPVDEDE